MFVWFSCLLWRELWLLSQAVLQAACALRVDWTFLCSFSLIPSQPFQVSGASAERQPCVRHISFHACGGRAHCCCSLHFFFFFLHVVFEKWDAAGPRADLLVTFLVCWPDHLGKSLLYWKTRSHYGREVPRVQVAAVSPAEVSEGSSCALFCLKNIKLAFLFCHKFCSSTFPLIVLKRFCIHTFLFLSILPNDACCSRPNPAAWCTWKHQITASPTFTASGMSQLQSIPSAGSHVWKDQ